MNEPGMKEFAKSSRTRYLKSSIHDLRVEIKSDTDLIRDMLPTTGSCLIPMVEKRIEKLKWNIQKSMMEKRSLEGKTKEGDITPSMIEQAKEYQISSLIEVDRAGKAKCINHEDKHPSMDCRKNFVHCYSCGYSDDSIGVYRKLHNVGFIEAVKALTSAL